LTSTIKADIEREISHYRVGWAEFPIFPNNEVVDRAMFQVTGYKRRYRVCFFDIPNILDNSEASTKFFEALAETDSISLFSHMTI
jgi:hypothetical protein